MPLKTQKTKISLHFSVNRVKLPPYLKINVEGGLILFFESLMYKIIYSFKLHSFLENKEGKSFRYTIENISVFLNMKSFVDNKSCWMFFIGHFS